MASAECTITVKLDAAEFIAELRKCGVAALFLSLTLYRFKYGWRRFLMRDYWRTLYRWHFPNAMSVPEENRRLFCGMTYDGGFWFRILGHGLSVQDKTKHPPVFSERHGHRRVLRLGKWGVEILQPVQ